MFLKLITFLLLYFCVDAFTISFAEDHSSALVSPSLPLENRKKQIESGSLEAIAIKDNWNLEQLDTALEIDYLTNMEKDIILALNMVRTDPGRYAELYIRPIASSFFGNRRRINGRNLITDEGCVPVEELYIFLIHHVPVPALVTDKRLHSSADELALDQSLTGNTGHISSKGRGFAVRIRSYAQWKKGVSETVGYGGKTGFDIVNNMLIDDGVSDRGHRLIMMDPVFHFVGSSVRPHGTYGFTAVIDYASSLDDPIKNPRNRATRY